jgi:hypothetical protein
MHRGFNPKPSRVIPGEERLSAQDLISIFHHHPEALRQDLYQVYTLLGLDGEPMAVMAVPLGWPPPGGLA